LVKGIFLDFYGTVVYEDDEIIKEITQQILNTGGANSTSEIGAYWWKEFQTACINAYGDTFKTQRELELISLQKTIEKFESTASVEVLSEKMFKHWIQPEVFPESKGFFEKAKIPIYIVSNIDREDVMAAIGYHGLTPDGVFTSEDARSYKPRRELFELALSKTGLLPEEVIHIGDSISSDVKGASGLGIKAIWINRGNKKNQEGIETVSNLIQVYDLEKFR
jgi:2-haloacid dehalogenase/putative hydrolase of the HAD superfamily